MEGSLLLLPSELLVIIFLRCDPATLFRCSATCKLLRRVITDPRFPARIYHIDRFIPSLFHGFFLEVTNAVPRRPPIFELIAPATATPSGARLTSSISQNANIFASYRPVESRGGMLVLRRRVAPQNGVDLCVCHPISGRCSLLPPITVNDRSHVLLPGDDADGSYQLLTVDRAFQIHTFSSKDGSWGGRAVQMPPVGEQTRWLLRSPAVIHGIVYWLALSPGTTVHNRSETVEDYRILAFDVNTLQVTSIGLPPHWQRRCSPLVSPYNLLLAPWTDGRLSLLVSEFNVICMWTLSPAGSWAWAQREVINKGTILRSLEPLLPKPQLCFDIKFEWFGERSGMVIFQLHGIGVVLLNLQTMEVRKLREGQRWSSSLQFCPYEMDFTSWLPTLRSFM